MVLEPSRGPPGAVMVALSKTAQKSSCGLAAILVVSEGGCNLKAHPTQEGQTTIRPCCCHLSFVVVPQAALFLFSNSCGQLMSFLSWPLPQISQPTGFISCHHDHGEPGVCGKGWGSSGANSKVPVTWRCGAGSN